MIEMVRKAWTVLRDERGIETAEWVVVLGFIVIVGVAVYGAGGNLPTLLTNIFTGITTTLAPIA